MSSNAIHQEITLAAAPTRVYQLLTDSVQFAGFSGAPAEINAEAGGAFSCFGGMISGRNIELIANVRIVQAWRAGNWPEGTFSIVRIDLSAAGADTRLNFQHTGFPSEQSEHLSDGWNKMYWQPLARYLG